MTGLGELALMLLGLTTVIGLVWVVEVRAIAHEERGDLALATRIQTTHRSLRVRIQVSHGNGAAIATDHSGVVAA